MSPVGHIASKYNFRIAHTAMSKYLAQVNIPLSLFGSLSRLEPVLHVLEPA